MKTIGVIGGLGPQATMDFEVRVHEVSQRLVPRRWNSGYPPMVVYYHRFPPMLRDEEDQPIRPLQPDPHMLEAAAMLGEMVDFIVVTSNTPHIFQAELEKASGRKVLSMLSLVLDEVTRRGWKRVGVLGLGEPFFYTGPLTDMSLACETLSGEVGGLRNSLDEGIRAVMEGRSGPEQRAIAEEAVANLRSRGTDGIILGCTEIPLLLGDAAQADDFINPIQLLAEATVRFAIE